jgi:hypothetical protein
MPPPRKVFCSHRGVDKAEVDAFARRLREAGIDAWFDSWEIAAGDDIVASMNRGLSECDARQRKSSSTVAMTILTFKRLCLVSECAEHSVALRNATTSQVR